MTDSREQLDAILCDVWGIKLDSILVPMFRQLAEHKALAFSYSTPPKRFRTTVQATCLLSLCRTGLIGVRKRKFIQDAIVGMRDSWHLSETDFEGGLQPPTKKYEEDAQAWCVTETPSVWATSYAIWSLLASGYTDNENTVIWPAVEWLVTQQDDVTGGFAYQKYKDCVPTVYLTCLAIKALRAVLNTKIILQRNPDAIPVLQSVTARGLNFVQKCARQTCGVTVFAGNQDVRTEKFDWISTIWGYTALIQNRFTGAPNTQELFTLLRKEFEDESKTQAFWEDNNFLNEAHTKYGVQKTYFYFMPSLLVPLIGLGIDPSDPICIKILQKLKHMFWEIGWPAVEYRKTEVCTFSTALGLQSLSLWVSMIPLAVARRFLKANGAGVWQIPAEIEFRQIVDTYEKKIKRLKRYLWAALPLIIGVISAFNIPWSKLISARNPLLIPAMLFELSLCICIAWLCIEGRQQRLIAKVIGFIAAVLTIVLTVWTILISQ